jgi:hypothetical protein
MHTWHTGGATQCPRSGGLIPKRPLPAVKAELPGAAEQRPAAAAPPPESAAKPQPVTPLEAAKRALAAQEVMELAEG